MVASAALGLTYSVMLHAWIVTPVSRPLYTGHPHTPHGIMHGLIPSHNCSSSPPRIEDCRAETVLTVDQGVRGGKTLELKRTVDEAVEGLAFVRHVFVMKRTGGSVPHTPRDVSLEEVGLG